MSTRTVNTTLFALVALQWASGLSSFLVGAPSGRWVVWLHALGGFAICVLLVWKGRVILRSLARHGLGWWAAPSLVLLALLLLTLGTGIAWITVGVPSIGAYSGMTLHVALSLAMLPLFAAHAWKPKPHPRVRDYFARRTALRRVGLLAAGVGVWQAGAALSGLGDTSGSKRRFTGSRQEVGSGLTYPATSWIADHPDPIAVDAWRLRVDGRVVREQSLTLADLTSPDTLRATLDCTGGWYADRAWQGVRVASLLERAGVHADARSVVVHAVSGYRRRFPLDVANGALLARAVDGERLTHGYGAPLRLVVPGRRGYDRVKWVDRIEVSSLPWWLNWPLPVR